MSMPNAGFPAPEKTSEGTKDMSQGEMGIWDIDLDNWDQNNT